MPAFNANPREGKGSRSKFQDKDKPTQIRYSNITAAKGMNNYSSMQIDIYLLLYFLKLWLFLLQSKIYYMDKTKTGLDLSDL